MSQAKKMIEVAIPLDSINRASIHEKAIHHGHPSGLHLWWARRPLAACRAVLFAQLVDDPSAHPEKFVTEEEQDLERRRLFDIIEELVKWKNVNNHNVLRRAREEILKSTDNTPPPIFDPFCGGGSIPLEAIRLGMKAYASDINPVAVLITKSLIEIPSRFAEKPPIHLGAQQSIIWKGAKGLADDLQFYGKWMLNEVEKRIGKFYPSARLPEEYGGGDATVIAWIWVREVKCPNPACGEKMPLVRSFTLSSKKNNKAWVEPIVEKNGYHFEVRKGRGKPREGTVNRSGAKCLHCETPVPFVHIRSEGKAGRMSERLMAIVAEGNRERVYISPTREHETIVSEIEVEEAPDTPLPEKALGFRVQQYGMIEHRDLFTSRQLLTMTTFSNLVSEAREIIKADALKSGMKNDNIGLNDGGKGAEAYSDAVATYLGIAVSRLANRSSTICFWDTGGQKIQQVFARQAIPMTWDFVEGNPFSNSSGNWLGQLKFPAECLKALPLSHDKGIAFQADVRRNGLSISQAVVATDPPYYDNIGYADLSDFFYVWLRKSLGRIHPDLFRTMLTPKAEELIASPFRFDGSKEKAKEFFENGLKEAFINFRNAIKEDYPITLFYAFKQSETTSRSDSGKSSQTASTGWETMLSGLLDSGFTITGTWPIRTELVTNLKKNVSALASSIVLSCRKRTKGAGMTTRRDFLNKLKQELPRAISVLQKGNIAPVDMAQSAIGPGMAVFSQYEKVLEADGTSMPVRAALALINQVLDEYLAEQEGEYDAETRWAVAWFEQFGMEEGQFGVAETLSKAKNTAVDGLVKSGILRAKTGTVCLLSRDELPGDWDPTKDKRISIWEVTQHLIKTLVDEGSEEAAAQLLAKVGALGELARDLAYRLYTICEKKKWSKDALAYNSFVVSWPELIKLSRQSQAEGPVEQELF